MISLSKTKQANFIESFNSKSRYLDDLSNIDYPYFERYGQSNLSTRSLIKPMLQIPKPHLWIDIDLSLMVLCPLKYRMTLILLK